MAVGKKRSRQLRLFDEEKIKLVNSETLRLWKKYQQYMSIKELSEKTIYNYNTDLRQWFIYILDYQFNESVLMLEEDDILEFISFCKDNGNNTERIKRRLSTISAFYKYLKKKRILQGDSPTEYIDRPKKGLPVVIQTYLTEEQLELIREKLNELSDIQLTTYVELSLSTMARVNAISHLRWKQIDFENRVIEDVLEKEQRYVTLYFSEKVKDLLLQLKEYRETNNINDYGWLWYTPYVNEEKCVSNSTLASWTKRVSDMVDIPLHCHTWRKSASNLLKKKGMPLEDISTLLNHLDTSTTKKHYINSQDSNISALKDKYNI